MHEDTSSVGGLNLDWLNTLELERIQDNIFDASMPDLARLLEILAPHVPERLQIRTQELATLIDDVADALEKAYAAMPNSFDAAEAVRRLRSKPLVVFAATIEATFRRTEETEKKKEAVDNLHAIREQVVQLVADICVAKAAEDTGGA